MLQKLTFYLTNYYYSIHTIYTQMVPGIIVVCQNYGVD